MLQGEAPAVQCRAGGRPPPPSLQRKGRDTNRPPLASSPSSSALFPPVRCRRRPPPPPATMRKCIVNLLSCICIALVVGGLGYGLLWATSQRNPRLHLSIFPDPARRRPRRIISQWSCRQHPARERTGDWRSARRRRWRFSQAACAWQEKGDSFSFSYMCGGLPVAVAAKSPAWAVARLPAKSASLSKRQSWHPFRATATDKRGRRIGEFRAFCPGLVMYFSRILLFDRFLWKKICQIVDL